MATEATRGILRIFANYIRLFAGLALGIVWVRWFVGWLDQEAFGLISLIVVTLGFAGLFQQLANQGVLRELGAAYHSGDDDLFIDAYNSSYVISFAAAAVCTLMYLIAIALVPLLDVPPEWTAATRWILIGRMVFAFAIVAFIPAFSMYRVREQFGWYAFWMLIQRATELASVILLAWIIGLEDIAESLTWYGIVWNGLITLSVVASTAVVVFGDRRLRIRPSRIRRVHWKAIAHTFGWNSTVHVAMGLHERMAGLIMNLAFGVFGNAVFGFALRLVSYARMATTGVTFGLDSTSARLATAETDPVARADAVRDLFRHSTRLQGWVALPAGLAIFILAEQLFTLWFGDQIQTPEKTIPIATTIARVLVIALVIRAISDGWMFMLYGAGYVRRYAPLILIGGIVSPLAGLALLYVFWSFPDRIRMVAPALGMTIVFTIVHMMLLPTIAARCLGVHKRDLILPLTRPALTTIICSPLLIVPALQIEQWNLLTLAAVCLGFSVVYTALSCFTVLTAQERTRFTGAIRRRIPGASASE